ncbi:MAG TPA: hypothetical protein VGO68_09700 [Pyrinomonadaceae bacterium]|jgi:hypothetical protein|nr:hypothetical protein [Pyrinomonadaceae bacterium]
MAAPSTPRKRSLYEPFHRVFRAVVELFAHLIVVASLLGGIKLLEKLVHSLWGTDYLFFERIKLKYIFDGADLAILVAFLLWGVYLVIAAYVRKPE